MWGTEIMSKVLRKIKFCLYLHAESRMPPACDALNVHLETSNVALLMCHVKN